MTFVQSIAVARYSTIIFVSLFFISFLPAQNLPFNTWTSYTDMKEVRSIAVWSGKIWAATSGGVFLYDPASRVFSTYTNASGLGSNDVTSVMVNSEGTTWVGGQEGLVHRFDAQEKKWSIIRDIFESNRVQKGIRTLLQTKDSLLIGTDYGVSVYLVNRSEFGDSYSNFGFGSQARVNRILFHNNRIWVATDQGVASASRNSPNLSSPTAWTRYQSAQGLPSNNTNAIVVLRDTLIVGSNAGLAYFDGSGFQVMPFVSGKQVADLQVFGSSLVVLWNEGVEFSIGTISSVLSPVSILGRGDGGPAANFVVNGSLQQLFVSTFSKGLAYLNSSNWEYRAPDGPQSALFSSIVVDERGGVWAASGIGGRGKGFYRFHPDSSEGKRWKNYTKSQSPILGDDDYYKVSLGLEGRIWVSSWGKGVVEVVKDSIRRRIHASSKPSLAGAVPQDPFYVVIGGVMPDSQKTTWFVTRTSVDGNYLAQLINDTTFTYYKNLITPTEGRFTNIAIDRNGTKWLANGEPYGKPTTGLYYFNEKKVVSGTESSGGWGLMTTSDGLPHNSVLSLATDNEGAVCVGTDLGLMIVTDPLRPKQRKVTSFPLREQVIQAIAVDAVNNKWVGTKEGVFSVSPDGTQLLNQYTVSNTGGKLLDNDIRALAIDQSRGILYIGTEKGMSSLTISPIRTQRSFTTLELGPNPFQIPVHQTLWIKNLVANSRIKILSIDGRMITEFQSQGGGRAFWDGKDFFGKHVSTGIYYVVAYAENGDQITTGKIAVVRR